MNWSNQTTSFLNPHLFATTIEPTNLCPNQRAISRPLLFVHNYSVFIFGSILNILAFIVLMQNSLRCHSTFAYLAFLSLSNGILSFVRFMQWMMTFYFKIQVEHYLYTCRFSHFILDSLTHFSLLTLVCVNIDRARTVGKNRPNTRFSRSTFHSVLIKELVIAVILCAYHSHWLVKFGYEVDYEGKKQTVCGPNPIRTPYYTYFLFTIYPPFELIVFFCLPLLINLICTVMIVRSLRLRMRTAKRFRPITPISTESRRKIIQKRLHDLFSCWIPRSTTKSNIYSCFCFQIQCRRHREFRLQIGRTERSLIKYKEDNDSIDRQQTSTNYLSHDIQQITTITSSILNKNHRTRRIRDIHLSAMLIVLNVVYLLFNLPFNVHQTFAETLHKGNLDDCVMKFTHLLFDTLQQTYFSTNFFLYVLTNRRFREEFYNTMIKLCTRKEPYLLRRNQQRGRARSFSLHASSGMITNFNIEYRTIPLIEQHNRETVISDIELIEILPIQPHKIILTLDESEHSISELVTRNELPGENL